jgi:hypothetical protein
MSTADVAGRFEIEAAWIASRLPFTSAVNNNSSKRCRLYSVLPFKMNCERATGVSETDV